MINSDGHIKLTDFGLSKENISQKDQTNSFFGSPAYVTPEVLLKKAIDKPQIYMELEPFYMNY